MSRRLEGIDTPALVEFTALRLEDSLIVTGEKAHGDKLRAAIAALRALPTLTCEACSARCPLEFYDHIEIERDAQSAAKVECRLLLCGPCYKERTK